MSSAIKCPSCGGRQTRAIESRVLPTINAFKRRRKCKCGRRFTTYERIDYEVTMKKFNLRPEPEAVSVTHEGAD